VMRLLESRLHPGWDVAAGGYFPIMKVRRIAKLR